MRRAQKSVQGQPHQPDSASVTIGVKPAWADNSKNKENNGIQRHHGGSGTPTQRPGGLSQGDAPFAKRRRLPPQHTPITPTVPRRNPVEPPPLSEFCENNGRSGRIRVRRRPLGPPASEAYSKCRWCRRYSAIARRWLWRCSVGFRQVRSVRACTIPKSLGCGCCVSVIYLCVLFMCTAEEDWHSSLGESTVRCSTTSPLNLA